MKTNSSVQAAAIASFMTRIVPHAMLCTKPIFAGWLLRISRQLVSGAAVETASPY